MRKTKKVTLYITIIIIIISVILILSISTITKYLIEKYDEEYTGRQITMDWAYVNPITGYVYFSNLNIYEFKSDSLFFSGSGIGINIGLLKLLSNKYEITELTLDNPIGKLIQTGKLFNFQDLTEKFSSKEDSAKTKKEQYVNILNIKINNGEFHYIETTTPINYFIKKVNIESPGYRWNVDSIPIKFAFSSGIGNGDINGDFNINYKNKDYTLAILIQKFDMNIIGQYIKDLSNYGSFRAILDADFLSVGNLIDREHVTNSGNIQISDFHLGKNTTEDYLSFEKFEVSIHELSPHKRIYFYDSIALHKPYFKYERYDELDNLQNMFGKNGSNITAVKEDSEKFNLVIEISKYIKTLTKNLLKSNYRVDKLRIYNGNIQFNDYTLNEKFSSALNPMSFSADSINKLHKLLTFKINSGISPYGNMSVFLNINPKDSTDFDIYFHLNKLPITLLNPYIIKYTSHPLNRGSLDLKSKWIVRNGIINSTNHLVIIDPRVGDIIRNKNSNWLPAKLLMYFVREKGNVIDYEIPIKGNLKDPKFNLRDIVFDVFTNIFVKPASTGYRMKVNKLETEIENSLSFTWEMRSSELTHSQTLFLENMKKFLDENSQASIQISPQHYTQREKEYILFYEAKKKYYLKYKLNESKVFTQNDSIKVEKMSIKDSLFILFLNQNAQDSLLFTVQDKCYKLIGSGLVDKKFNLLKQERENVFMQFFSEKNTSKRIKLKEDQSIIPFNGFSVYKIEYKGEYPEYLKIAYDKMSKLNHEKPRKAFLKSRNVR